MWLLGASVGLRVDSEFCGVCLMGGGAVLSFDVLGCSRGVRVVSWNRDLRG